MSFIERWMNGGILNPGVVDGGREVGEGVDAKRESCRCPRRAEEGLRKRYGGTCGVGACSMHYPVRYAFAIAGEVIFVDGRRGDVVA